MFLGKVIRYCIYSNISVVSGCNISKCIFDCDGFIGCNI